MSFYTSLTGLKAATTELALTSNNIANVGTSGFKKSRASFGDIFATSPLQKSTSVVGQGVSQRDRVEVGVTSVRGAGECAQLDADLMSAPPSRGVEACY